MKNLCIIHSTGYKALFGKTKQNKKEKSGQIRGEGELRSNFLWSEITLTFRTTTEEVQALLFIQITYHERKCVWV